MDVSSSQMIAVSETRHLKATSSKVCRCNQLLFFTRHYSGFCSTFWAATVTSHGGAGAAALPPLQHVEVGDRQKTKKGVWKRGNNKNKRLFIYIYTYTYIYNFSREKMGTWRLICEIFGVATPLGLLYRTKHPVVGALHELPGRCSNARRALCRNPTENATPRSWLCYRLPQVDGEYF